MSIDLLGISVPVEIFIGAVIVCLSALWRRSPQDGWVRYTLLAVVPTSVALLSLTQSGPTAYVVLGTAAAYLLVALFLDRMMAGPGNRASHMRLFVVEVSALVNGILAIEERIRDRADHELLELDANAATASLQRVHPPDTRAASLRNDYGRPVEDEDPSLHFARRRGRVPGH